MVNEEIGGRETLGDLGEGGSAVTVEAFRTGRGLLLGSFDTRGDLETLGDLDTGGKGELIGKAETGSPEIGGKGELIGKTDGSPETGGKGELIGNGVLIGKGEVETVPETGGRVVSDNKLAEGTIGGKLRPKSKSGDANGVPGSPVLKGGKVDPNLSGLTGTKSSSITNSSTGSAETN